MRAIVGTAVLVLALGACVGEDDDLADAASQEAEAAPAEVDAEGIPSTLESVDGTVTIRVPKGWTEPAGDLPPTVAIAAQGPDPLQQVVVTPASSRQDADDRATSTAAGLASDGIKCERTALEGRTVLDCPQDVDGEIVRRLLFPVGDQSSGAVLLVQTPAETLQEAGELALPVADSLTVG